LLEDVGLRPVFVGSDDAIAVVDGVTRLWFALAVRLTFRTLGISDHTPA
jgi:hypothetical protein